MNHRLTLPEPITEDSDAPALGHSPLPHHTGTEWGAGFLEEHTVWSQRGRTGLAQDTGGDSGDGKTGRGDPPGSLGSLELEGPVRLVESAHLTDATNMGRLPGGQRVSQLGWCRRGAPAGWVDRQGSFWVFFEEVRFELRPEWRKAVSQ